MVVWGFGVGVLDWVFWGLGFQLMRFEACGVGPSGFFLVLGSLYKHKGITLGKMVLDLDLCLCIIVTGDYFTLLGLV